VNRAATVALSAFFAASCVVQPRDPFDRGTAAVHRGDLLGALRAFESVPPSHPRHAEALAFGNDVEGRIRRGHQALLEGLVLRSEGRDREALASMERARLAWPGLPSIGTWITVTRDRAVATNAAPAAAEPVVAPSATPVAPADVTAAPDAAEQRTESETSRPGSDSAAETSARGEGDPVTLGLVAVEARLGHGELELAVIDLMELARRFPSDQRVQNRLVRVLHQRALLRYGQGALTTAIADWERVLSIQPDNRVVRALLEAVRSEAAAPL